MRASSALALIAVSVVLGLLVAQPAPADGAPLADCTAHRGTIVAVDFGHWGGPIVRGCALGQPTGYALLHAAGFTTAGDAQDGDVYICRLGDEAFRHGTQYPTASEDPCIVTPPASAYWSYWVAPAGHDTWTYSSLGPLGDVPKPGEVELWRFGSTTIGATHGSGVPHVSPSTLRAATATSAPTPQATTSTTTQVATPPTTPTRATRTAATRHARAKPKRPPRHRAHKHATATSTVSTAGTAPHASPPLVAAQPTRTSASAGSPLPLVVGICVALALAAAGGWTAWRRRQLE